MLHMLGRFVFKKLIVNGLCVALNFFQTKEKTCFLACILVGNGLIEKAGQSN